MRRFKLLLAALGLSLLTAVCAQADPLVIPLPLTSPVSISLTSNPIITIGSRTINFTSNLNQEFIDFLPSERNGGPGFYRVTLGVRARDGLASISGIFPLSPDPTFANQLPVFSVGTTDLLLFDLSIPGSGTPFYITLTDLSGTTHVAQFSTPVPEPTTIFLLGMGLAYIGVITRKRREAGRLG